MSVGAVRKPLEFLTRGASIRRFRLPCGPAPATAAAGDATPIAAYPFFSLFFGPSSFFLPSGLSRAAHMLRRLQRRRSPDAPNSPELPSVESAKQLSAATPSYLARPLRHHLARSFTTRRVLLSLLSIAGPLVHSLYGEWDFIHTFGSLPNDARILTYLLSLYVPSLIIAASFPVDPSSREGYTFSFVPLVVGAILRCFGVCLDLHHTSTHVNSACALVHRVMAVVVLGVWLTAAIQGARRCVSWKTARIVHTIEGSALVLCTLMLRVLGPPASYSPGEMSFTGALVRGGLAIFLGTFVLSPSNRRRAFELTSWLGLNHIAISLGELTNVSEARRELRLPSECTPPSREQAQRQSPFGGGLAHLNSGGGSRMDGDDIHSFDGGIDEHIRVGAASEGEGAASASHEHDEIQSQCSHHTSKLVGGVMGPAAY